MFPESSRVGTWCNLLTALNETLHSVTTRVVCDISLTYLSYYYLVVHWDVNRPQGIAHHAITILLARHSTIRHDTRVGRTDQDPTLPALLTLRGHTHQHQSTPAQRNLNTRG